MPIPNTITRKHVLQALAKIDLEGVPKMQNYKNTALTYEGKHYPTKLVISWAHIFVNGQEFPVNDFITQQSSRYLKDLGFEITYF